MTRFPLPAPPSAVDDASAAVGEQPRFPVSVDVVEPDAGDLKELRLTPAACVGMRKYDAVGSLSTATSDGLGNPNLECPCRGIT